MTNATQSYDICRAIAWHFLSIYKPRLFHYKKRG